tara:strand:+ start:2609 stop:3244 length:636 start_codon:yes stop_codon:yes gene_type:complete
LQKLIDKSIYIFDFDGVLVDSVKIKTESFALIYKPFGIKVVNKVINHHLENGGMSRFDKFKFYHKNFLNINLNKDDLSILNIKFSSLVKNKVIKAPEIPGATQYLFELNKNKRVYVNSATPKNELLEIISKRGWSNYFIDILGSPKSKTENIQYIIDKEKRDLKEFVFFGDAINDYKAAKKIGIDFVQLKTNNNELIGNPILSIYNFHEII